MGEYHPHAQGPQHMFLKNLFGATSFAISHTIFKFCLSISSLQNLYYVIMF